MLTKLIGQIQHTFQHYWHTDKPVFGFWGIFQALIMQEKKS
jgi:hypothetical protein